MDARRPERELGQQLDSYYREQPVFAMVGGLSDRGWGPVGRFCEEHEIACLYPGVDMPQASEGHFYTLYFSRGLGLEADLIATSLKARPAKNVVQVFVRKKRLLRRKFCSVSYTRKPRPQRTSLLTVQTHCRLASSSLGCKISPIQRLYFGLAPATWSHSSRRCPGAHYLSSTLLDAELPSSMGLTRSSVFMAHPFRLPGKPDPAMRRFGVWAKTRDIEVTQPRLQAEAFFACLVLNDAMKHIGRFFVRDFALDMLDHAQGLMAYLPVHPRPTIGPGQRFLTKGGYILPIVDGNPETKNAEWVLP